MITLAHGMLVNNHRCKFKVSEVIFVLFLSSPVSLVASSLKSTEEAKKEIPTSSGTLSRWGIFTEIAPGEQITYHSNPDGFLPIPVVFFSVGGSFSPVDSCRAEDKFFCWRLLVTAKFGIGYGPLQNSTLINPMIGTDAILVLGHQRYVGIILGLSLGYGFSTIANQSNPHYAHFDLGAGL